MAVVDTERAGGAPESKRARLAPPPQEAGEASGGSGVGAGGVEGGALLPSPVRTPPVCAPHSPLRHPHSPLRLKPGEEPVAEAAVGKALTVATLNLWATDRQTEETRKRRGHAAAQALKKLQPDVICLQEATLYTLEPIFELLCVGETGMEGVLYVSVEPEGGWPWVTKGGNDMLVRSDLAITEARSLKYGNGGGRAMLAAKIELSSSQHVWVAATHLSAPNVRRAAEWKCRERQSQAKEALRALDYLFLMGRKETAVKADAAASDIGDDLADASAGCGLAANADLSTTTCAGCILAGDLNWSEAHRPEPTGGNFAEGDGPILSDEQRDAGWLDVWPALHEKTGEPGFTFNTRRNDMLEDWLGRLGVDGLRLDRVLARLDPAALKPAAIHLFADNCVEGPLVESHRKDVRDPVPLFVSDHFGVVAYFHPPGAGGPCGAAGTQTPSASPSSDDKKYSTQWSTP